MSVESVNNILFAKKYLGSIKIEEYIEWAIDMLGLGFDSKKLRILAGLSNPLDPSEVNNHFEDILKELNILKPNEEEAVMYYAISLCEQMISSELNPRNGLKRLYKICQDLDYDSDYMIWYELDDALASISYGDYPYMYEHMNKYNVDQCIIREAKTFIREFKNTDP